MTQYNKVIYDGNTLIDLTGDTVDAGSLLKGTTAHDRSGAQINGTLDPVYQDAVATVYDSTDASQFPVAVGDLRMHEGILYEANQAISTAESWTAAHWTAVTVEELVDDVAASIPTLPSDIHITSSTTDLTAGTSPLTTGYIYLVYE